MDRINKYWAGSLISGIAGAFLCGACWEGGPAERTFLVVAFVVCAALVVAVREAE